MEKEIFILTENHLKLLKNLHIFHSTKTFDTGAAAVYPNRPYGNSDVEGDIAEILKLDRINSSYIQSLHREVTTALQICLCTQSFTPGRYVKEDFCEVRSWKKVD